MFNLIDGHLMISLFAGDLGKNKKTFYQIQVYQVYLNRMY